jgi:DNA-binding NarL/FixJ family response regulator
MDALMPNLDGFETCQRLKMTPELAHIPVIFMTGLSDSESVVKGLQAGGVDYLTKPVKQDELLARMRVHLANARLNMSVKTALDSAGHFLLSINRSGELLWATPQAYQLFECAVQDDEWLTKSFPGQVKKVFSEHYHKQKGLRLNGLSRTVEARYISQTAEDEYLFRVVDLKGPTETELLRAAFPGITGREADVLLWISRGKTNREIGAIVDMSPRTVNKHLEQIYKKLGVENRTSAAAIALRFLEN